MEGNRRALPFLWAFFLVSLCFCDDGHLVNDGPAIVLGTVDCMGCAQHSNNEEDASSGMYVAIDCKAADGKLQTKGIGKLDKDGKFQVELPPEIVGSNAELREECFAELYRASHEPCPAQNSRPQMSKIVHKPEEKEDHQVKQHGITFVPEANLSSAAAICRTRLSIPSLHEESLPPVKKKPLLPLKKPFPPVFKKPIPPIPKLPPIYRKPHPPMYGKPFPPPFPKFPPPVDDEKPRFPIPNFPKRPINLPPKYKNLPPWVRKVRPPKLRSPPPPRYK